MSIGLSFTFGFGQETTCTSIVKDFFVLRTLFFKDYVYFECYELINATLVISYTGKIYKGLVDHTYKTVTWSLFLDLIDAGIISRRYGFSGIGELFQFSVDRIHIWYLDSATNQYKLKSFSLTTKALIDNVDTIGTITGGYSRAFNIKNKYIVTVHNQENTRYSVYNLETTEIFEVKIENDHERLSGYNYRKAAIAVGDYLYLVPITTETDTYEETVNGVKKTSDYIHLIWTHKVRLIENTWMPPKPITYPVPPKMPTFTAVKDVAEDAGMSFYGDNATGDIAVEYPKIKEYPDYVFETNVDIIELEFGTNSEAYDNVTIVYGVGEKAGTIRLGNGNNKYTRVSPKLTGAQAATLAELMYNPEYKDSAKIKVRGIPGLGVGKTVFICDPEGLAIFKGVIIGFQSENNLDSGYKCDYEIVGFILINN